MSAVVRFILSEEASFYRNVAAVVGAAWLLRFLLKHVHLLYSNFRAFVLPRFGVYKVDVTKYGSWAIVTGASEGIGRGYAIELARRGLNIAILSRSEEKLNLVANLIRDKYRREVRVIPVDFTKGQSVYSGIQAEISDLDVAVLVNNVGVISDPNFSHEVSEQRHRDIIEVNCQAMVQMTHLVMPKMAEKKRGIIINVSSLVYICPSPLLNVNSATKIFINYFTSALQYEYAGKGIIAQCVTPGMVATKIFGETRPGLLTPEPTHFARSALGTLGYQQTTFGYFPHTVLGYCIQLMPQWAFMMLMMMANSQQMKDAHRSR